MPRSRPLTAKIPQPVADALHVLQGRGVFGPYPSRNALIVGLLTYCVIFPRGHELTAGIARLQPHEQDEIHDFIFVAVERKLDLSALLPKPATAEALLALA